ncbi:YcfL family protein [Marinobacter sp. S6332]|uniref:YcfL family protein n=1 Tax=Marinobacter sp. S6332 TaxID=2926403 RepID=UPI001FF3B745|nr:YcfL family protein [Marinobacter sp. S6332]MCK0163043.1 YcfL family protein [Marinobacter sp. S6332]
MKSVLFASLLVLGLAGCASQPEVSNLLADRQELKVDPEVIYITAVTELFEERIPQPDGESLLQIQFAVEARSDAELAWKVTWFDAKGMTVPGVGEGYRKASLLTGQTRYFKATAPHSRATSYQLHLREPK